MIIGLPSSQHRRSVASHRKPVSSAVATVRFCEVEVWVEDRRRGRLLHFDRFQDFSFKTRCPVGHSFESLKLEIVRRQRFVHWHRRSLQRQSLFFKRVRSV